MCVCVRVCVCVCAILTGPGGAKPADLTSSRRISVDPKVRSALVEQTSVLLTGPAGGDALRLKVDLTFRRTGEGVCVCVCACVCVLF